MKGFLFLSMKFIDREVEGDKVGIKLMASSMKCFFKFIYQYLGSY